MAKELKRININFPVDALERVDEYADRMCINRTSAILVLVSQALDSQQALSDIGELVKITNAQKSADK